MNERCKSELRSSYLKCQEEGTSITNLINDILQKHKILLDNIDSYNAQEVIHNRNIILDSTQLNYLLFSKLFSINIELESFWKKCQEQAPKNILDLYDAEPNKAILSQEKEQAPSCSSIDDKLSASTSYEPTNVSTSTSSGEVTQIQQIASALIDVPEHNESNVKKVAKDKSISLNPLVANFYPSTEVLNNIIGSSSETINSSSSASYSEGKKYSGIASDTKANADVDSVRSYKKESSGESGDTNEEKLAKTVKNTCQLDDTIEPLKNTTSTSSTSKSTEAVLAKYKPKDRFERKFGDVKTEIPDLTFVRDDDSSDYYSVPDKDSTYKSLKNESEATIQPVKVKQPNIVKKDPKENYYEIPQHDAPNVHDSCIVMYVHNPSEFYITMLGNDLIISLGEQLAEYAKSRRANFKNKLDAKLAIGKYCIAYSEAFKSWNRALVLEWKMTEQYNVEIQYIDYGEYATVPYTYLIPIPSMFCKIPKQAIRCCLQHVIAHNKEEIWSLQSIKHFENLCYNDSQYTDIRIVSVEKKRDGLAIDFYKITDYNGATCSEMMIMDGYAKLVVDNVKDDDNVSSRNFMIEQIKHAQGLAGISDQDDISTALDKFGNEVPETYATIGDAMLGYNAQDDMRLCKFTRPDGTCFKGARCKLEHTRRRKNGITADTEVVFVAPDNTFMPEVNDVLSVNVTFFKSPSIVYGQVKHEGNQHGAAMKQMFKCMNKKQMIKSYEKFQYDPAIGEFVIAKNFDERWYRATVLEINAGDSYNQQLVKLFFVDFGDVAEVSQQNVRKMKPGFILHPYQAIQLGVSNVKPLASYDPAAFKEFTSRYLFTNLSIKVKYAGANFIDGVFTDGAGNDLGVELINHNFAEQNTMDLHPLRSSNILVD